jgi:hypothetical protein
VDTVLGFAIFAKIVMCGETSKFLVVVFIYDKKWSHALTK